MTSYKDGAETPIYSPHVKPSKLANILVISLSLLDNYSYAISAVTMIRLLPSFGTSSVYTK